MKKLLYIAVAVLLLAAIMVLPIQATTGETLASGSTASSGQLAYVTIALKDCSAEVTSLGVSFTPDSGLTLDKANSAWLISHNGLADIGSFGNYATISIDASTNINCDILKLAFKMPEYTGKTEYTVSYSMNLTGDAGVIAKLNGSAKLTLSNPATSVTLNQSTLALDLNGTATAELTASVSPSNTTDTVVWSSTDEAVATVVNGKVTALKAGTATITATAGSKSASCQVTVSCSHDMTETPAASSTCEAAGTKGTMGYFTCEVCNGVYTDAAGTTATTVADRELDFVDHSNVSNATCQNKAVCTWCGEYGDYADHAFATELVNTDPNQHYYSCTTEGCTAKKDAEDHDYDWETVTPSVFPADGLEKQACKDCGYENGQTRPIIHNHQPQKTAAKAATCSATGNLEYWTCAGNGCAGKFFTTSDCTTEHQGSVELAIDLSNHGTNTTRLESVVAPSCWEAGYTGDTYCDGCDNKIATGTADPATGNHTPAAAWETSDTQHWHKCTTTGCTEKLGLKDHEYKWVVDDPATEDKTGLKHEECECGVKRSEGTVIEKLDHVHIGITHHEAVKATCIKAGTVEYWTCSSHKCADKYYSDDACQLPLATIVEPIDPDNHSTELRNAKEATCTAEGYTGDTVCTACEQTIVEGKVIPKKDHTPEQQNAKEATCTAEGYTGDMICTGCEEIITAGEVIPMKAHELKAVAAAEPTYTTPGNIDHFSCAGCQALFLDAEGKTAATAAEVIIPQLIQVEEDKAEVTDEAIDKAIEDATQGESTKDIILDLDAVANEGVQDNEQPVEITEVQLPVAALDKVAQLDANSTLTITVSEATLVLDNAALQAVAKQAEGDTVTLMVKTIETSQLNTAQQDALKNMEVAQTLTAEMICVQSNKAISDFEGGSVTVQIPFVPAEGTKGSDYKVIYVADDGSIENIATSYENGNLVVSLSHFSEYVIVNAAQKDPTNPSTSDWSNLALIMAVSVIAVWVVLGFVLWSKKAAAKRG